MKKGTSPLLVSLILAIVLMGTMSSLALMPSNTFSAIPFGQHPQVSFSPPASKSGNGYTLNLTESMNGWQADEAMNTSNLAHYSWRNASFSASAPTGYSKILQSIAISELTATSDIRVVQGGDSPNGFLRANNASANFQYLAMRFTTLDRVNVTGVWLHYSLSLTDTLLFGILSTGTTNSTTPAGGTVIGYGTLQGTGGVEQWGYSPLNSPVTISSGNYYWVVVDAHLLPSGHYFDWNYYFDDPGGGGTGDKMFLAGYKGAWFDEFTIHNLGGVPYSNFMLMLKVLPVSISDPSKVRTYGSPLEVAMNETNSNTRLLVNTTSIAAVYDTFTLTTNTSVTFTLNWTARFERYKPNQVTTQYDARNGFTIWNANFTSDSEPSNTYTWFNRTFRVSPVPQFWNGTDKPPAVWNSRGYGSSFSNGTGYYLITQSDSTLGGLWDANWGINAKSIYKITASLPSQVVAGLSFTLSVFTTPYSSSLCNISFFDHIDQIEYTNNAAITGSSYEITLKLNRSDTYTLYLFSRWALGNEVSLESTININVIEALCNVTDASTNSPILGDLATAQFRFRNGTAGWTAMEPVSVKINGTAVSHSYDILSGITTVSWTTIVGGWRSGSNHVNITAVSGVFFNFTVASLTIIPPDAGLSLDAASYSATYADSVSIGFIFLNLTGGSPKPFPSAPTLYRNGTTVTFASGGGGWYFYSLDTRIFAQAGVYHLNFTAKYLAYTATNITTLNLLKIPMSLSIQTPQTSVTIGSSLSVSAVLAYGNGTIVHDGPIIQFNFIVSYTNGSVITIGTTAVINNGLASSSLLAASDMKSINVTATYAGNGIMTPATDLEPNIQVVAPQGLSLMTIMIIGGGGGALVVALVGLAKYRGARKRTEVRKTKALVQTASLAQLIVVHLASGRALYSRSIGSEESADPNLISGFLSANQSIIAEVFKKQPGAGLKFADYGEYKVVSNVGNYVMATLFCTESAGEELQGVLQSFTDKFEKKYAAALKTWDGNMNVFKDADDIADEVFSLPLCSPYMLLEAPISKLSKDERAAVHTARILSAERGVFFMPRVVDFLLTKQGLKRGKAMDVINSLTKKGVFRQLTIEQAAQVVKSTTERSG